MKCFLFGGLAIALATGACSAASMDGLGLDDPQGAAAAGDGGASGSSSTSTSGSSDSGSSSIGTAGDDSGIESSIDAGKPDSGSVASGDVFSGDGAFMTSSPPNGHHNPGKDCLSCHGNGGGGAPEFSFAGTLYNAGGTAVSGAEVRVVDSMGNAASVVTASNGNFYQFAGSGFDAPGHAGIRNATTTDLMTSAVTDGSCNKCHCTGSGCTTAKLHLP